MNPVRIINLKGWLMLGVGALLLLLPVPVSAFAGATLTPAGALFAQLYGLVLLANGWSMAMVCTAPPARSECFAYVITDIVAAALLIVAQRSGVFGALIYVLIGAYAVSAVLFSYCYLNRATSEQAG